ncbi:MAG: ABC transporter substrate-binding protein [Lachnospiraceae bacterium]
MRKSSIKKAVALGLASTMLLSFAACSGNSGDDTKSSTAGNSTQGTADASGVKTLATGLVSIDQVNVGEDYQDVKADIKVLTDRTDIVNTVYAGYAEQFHQLYPNITVTYEAISDYAESVTLRLTTGDWGDICFIPATVAKSEMSMYFTELGSYDVLNEIYNFVNEKTYDGTVYGIPNGGNANGVVYNMRVWKEAGITELPTTPDEFLEDLQKIQDNTDAIPLYTNFSAGWTMGQWNQYVGCSTSGDPDYKNITLVHTDEPFTKTDENNGPYSVFYVLYEAVARDLVEEDPASSDWESSKGMINSGEIATMVLGSWAVQQCVQAGEHGEDVGYMPFPVTVDGKQYAGSGGNYAYGINAKASTENQIAAMVYMKWLMEESTIYEDEGSIPARKDGKFPAALSGFADVELISDSAALEGEESYYNDLCDESEILNSDYAVSNVVEAAMYGNKTLDELMNEWNQKWTSARKNLGIE